MQGLLHSYDKNVKLQNKKTKNIKDNSTNYKRSIITRP